MNDTICLGSTTCVDYDEFESRVATLMGYCPAGVTLSMDSKRLRHNRVMCYASFDIWDGESTTYVEGLTTGWSKL